MQNSVGTKAFKSGFIAIAGRPNTGKSTFLNRVLGRKVAIVTPKAQTTRTRILGVYNRPGCQMVFLDTPGIFSPGRSRLNQAMVHTALKTCRDVDVIIYFVEAPQGITDEDRKILDRLPRNRAPLLLAINKVDKVEKSTLLPKLQAAGSLPFKELVPISALDGTNVDHLLTLLPHLLPEGPRYFPEGQWTDQPEPFIAAEIIREKLFLNLQQELPYAIAVRVDHFQERPAQPGLWDMEVSILVDRASQKAIVIGHKGSLLKRVGATAREELERLLSLRLFLRLWVRVTKDWTGNPTLLRNLGYMEGDFGAGE